jgi:hypothetical protein
MNKNNKDSSTNSTAKVNSSITGATLQASNESPGFTVGSKKEQSNEQATAAKPDNLNNLSSNFNYGSSDETNKFNERTARITAQD